jgi:hypothetical protein
LLAHSPKRRKARPLFKRNSRDRETDYALRSTAMIGTLISIIVLLIIVGVVWWAIQQLLPLIPLPEPFRKIIYVLMMVVLVLIVIWVILTLVGAAGVHVPLFR